MRQREPSPVALGGVFMKINRLLEITTLLMNKEIITARELAGRFAVSTRTIYRDIDVLSSAGVPVYMSKGNGGGISLLDNYTLNKTLISEQESESLLVALKTLQAIKYPEVEQILNKLGAIFKNTADTDWVEIDFSHWGSMPNEKNKFNEIKKAVLQHKVITFTYVNADGIGTSRSAEPQKIFYKGSAWYLIAYCLYRQSTRVFRISRIKNVKITEEKYIPRKLSEAEKDELKGYSKPLVRMRLKFQPAVLNRLYDDFDDSLIVKNNDGSMEVEVVLPEDEWIYGYILSFGSFVEVLEPEHIRNIIVDKMKQALKKYKINF